MLAAERVELGGDLAVPTRRQLGSDAILQRQQLELHQTRSLGQQHASVVEPGERWAPPQPQTRAQHLCGHFGILGERCPALADQGLELQRVERGAIDPDHIARSTPFDDRAEQLAQLRDVALHRVAGGAGRRVAPQPVDQGIGRDDRVGLGEQHRQHQLLTGAPQAQPSAVVAGMVALIDHAQWAEHLKAHTASIRTVFVSDVLGKPTRIEHETSMSRPDRKIVGTECGTHAARSEPAA